MGLQEYLLASLKALEILKVSENPKPSDLVVNNFMNEPLNVEKFLEDLQLAAKN